MAAARMEKERERSAANPTGSKPHVASIDKGARRALDETKLVHSRFWKGIRSQIPIETVVVSTHTEHAAKAGADDAGANSADDEDGIDFLDAGLGARLRSLDISNSHAGSQVGGDHAPEAQDLPSADSAGYRTPPLTQRHQPRFAKHADRDDQEEMQPDLQPAAEKEPKARELPTPGEGRLTRSAARKSISMRRADAAIPAATLSQAPAADPSMASSIASNSIAVAVSVAGVACGATSGVAVLQAMTNDDENEAPQTSEGRVEHAARLQV